MLHVFRLHRAARLQAGVHAHRGAPEGRTSAGAPVYNVSLPLMRTAYPDRPPFRLLDVSVSASGVTAAAEADAASAPSPPVEAEVS